MNHVSKHVVEVEPLGFRETACPSGPECPDCLLSQQEDEMEIGKHSTPLDWAIRDQRLRIDSTRAELVDAARWLMHDMSDLINKLDSDTGNTEAINSLGEAQALPVTINRLCAQFETAKTTLSTLRRLRDKK